MKEQKHLITRGFTSDEEKTITYARQLAGVDRPKFYHDCIMAAAMRIIATKEGQQNV